MFFVHPSVSAAATVFQFLKGLGTAAVFIFVYMYWCWLPQRHAC
jgi:hypothetical protein